MRGTPRPYHHAWFDHPNNIYEVEGDNKTVELYTPEYHHSWFLMYRTSTLRLHKF
jgi:hypothetical protein